MGVERAGYSMGTVLSYRIGDINRLEHLTVAGVSGGQGGDQRQAGLTGLQSIIPSTSICDSGDGGIVRKEGLCVDAHLSSCMTVDGHRRSRQTKRSRRFCDYLRASVSVRRARPNRLRHQRMPNCEFQSLAKRIRNPSLLSPHNRCQH